MDEIRKKKNINLKEHKNNKKDYWKHQLNQAGWPVNIVTQCLRRVESQKIGEEMTWLDGVKILGWSMTQFVGGTSS